MIHSHMTCSECWWDELLYGGRTHCHHGYYYRYHRYERPYRYGYRYDRYRYEREVATVDLEALSVLLVGACKGTAFLAKFAAKLAKQAHQGLQHRHLGTAA